MRYKVWHSGLEDWIHDKCMMYIDPDGDVYEIDTSDAGYMYKNCMTDFVKVVRSTQLTDRNGKEIYEGDLLKDEQGVGEVEWVQEHCAYLVFTKSDEGNAYNRLESDGQLMRTEVIGNIYEHPHLVKGE